MSLRPFALKYCQTIVGFNAEMLFGHLAGREKAFKGNKFSKQLKQRPFAVPLQNVWLFNTSGLFQSDAPGDTEA